MPSLAAACTRAPALFLVDARGFPSTRTHSSLASPSPLSLPASRQSAAAMNAAAELAAAATASTPSLLRPNQERHHLLLLQPRLLTSLTGAFSRCCSPPPGQLPSLPLLLWPRHHGPPRAKLDRPAGARGPPGSPPPILRRRRTFSGRNSKLRPSSALFFRPGTSRKNSRKEMGLSAEPMTHVNSVVRTGL